MNSTSLIDDFNYLWGRSKIHLPPLSFDTAIIRNFLPQIFSIIITAVYSGISFESDSSVQDIKGFLVILATEVLFSFVYAVFMLIYEVLPLLRKETGDRLYSLSAYYVSLVLLMVSREIINFIFNFRYRSQCFNFLDSPSCFRNVYVHGDYLLLNWHRAWFHDVFEFLIVNHVERNLCDGLWLFPFRTLRIALHRHGAFINCWSRFTPEFWHLHECDICTSAQILVVLLLC